MICSCRTCKQLCYGARFDGAEARWLQPDLDRNKNAVVTGGGRCFCSRAIKMVLVELHCGIKKVML